MKKNQNTQQERLSIDELMRNSLATKAEKIANFNKFFKFLAGFHHYSYYNTMLVYLQNPEVKMFGTSAFWKKKYNRTIKPDARAYIILIPMGPTTIAYDIAETEGEDDVAKVLETFSSKKAEGTIKATQMQETIDAASEWSIKIEKIKLQESLFGYIIIKENQNPHIILNKNNDDVTNFTTLLHELAHLFLGHTTQESVQNKTTKKTIKIKLRTLDKNTKEMEAETVCFLISKRMGIKSQSADYLAGHLENKGTVEEILANFSYETVIKVADKIESMFC